jgi:hypothetical protein
VGALPEASSQGQGVPAAESGSPSAPVAEESLRRKNEFKQAIIDIFNATPV